MSAAKDAMKEYLKQNDKEASNRYAYAQDLHDFDGENFDLACRGFKCNVAGSYQICYAGMVSVLGVNTYVTEYCNKGEDYLGKIVNIITTDEENPVVVAGAITLKW